MSPNIERCAIVAYCVAFVLIIYLGFAAAIFEWRNPTANRMTLFRELPAVLTFQKLDRYQGNR